jgi:hypothetical protein
MNIIPCIGLQVNYFPSFQKLSAINQTESSAKPLMRPAAGSAPVAAKCEAVISSTRLKFSLYNVHDRMINEYGAVYGKRIVERS